jgi:predicted TIM-barrel fold metal-dependent hydrolase
MAKRSSTSKRSKYADEGEPEQGLQGLQGQQETMKKPSSNLKKLNTVLVVLIIFSLILLVYRYTILPQDEEFEPKLPNEGIVNIHEHIHKYTDADKWLDAMKLCGVSTTIMLGSPEATFLLSSPPGFNNYTKNNDVILYLEKEYDSKILAFPTIDPRDLDKLDYLKEQIASGAVGLKLFSGHTGEIFPEPKTTIYDYLGPLDRIDMDGVYDYCQRNHIPIIWHIKLKWDYLFNETKNVLHKFPDLIVNIPHFGVLGTDLSRLGELMDKYPGVYTDISFGGFAYWSMQLASNYIDEYRNFVNKYHTRVMFGTDMVVTNNVRKTVSWIANLTMGYRHMLEKDKFHINVSNITGEGFDFDMELNGFGLSQSILDEIYFDNALRFLKGDPAPNNLSRGRSWMSKHVDVETGQAISAFENLWLDYTMFLSRVLVLGVVATNKNPLGMK